MRAGVGLCAALPICLWRHDASSAQPRNHFWWRSRSDGRRVARLQRHILHEGAGAIQRLPRLPVPTESIERRNLHTTAGSSSGSIGFSYPGSFRFISFPDKEYRPGPGSAVYLLNHPAQGFAGSYQTTEWASELDPAAFPNLL